jgi:Phospholipase_D-nuclease N-terminal
MPRKRWSDLRPGQRAAVLAVGAAQVTLAVTAWADLARTPSAQVNGRKAVWAAVIAVNWIGPASWFRWGRRR